MLTSIEKQFLYNFQYDIRIGIPIVILFSLPIVGYSVPLFALFYSRYLPSTFILPKQKVILKRKQKKRNEIFFFFFNRKNILKKIVLYHHRYYSH